MLSYDKDRSSPVSLQPQTKKLSLVFGLLYSLMSLLTDILPFINAIYLPITLLQFFFRYQLRSHCK